MSSKIVDIVETIKKYRRKSVARGDTNKEIIILESRMFGVSELGVGREAIVILSTEWKSHFHQKGAE